MLVYPHACLWYFWEKMIHCHVHIPSEGWDVYICNKKTLLAQYYECSPPALPSPLLFPQKNEGI